MYPQSDKASTMFPFTEIMFRIFCVCCFTFSSSFQNSNRANQHSLLSCALSHHWKCSTLLPKRALLEKRCEISVHYNPVLNFFVSQRLWHVDFYFRCMSLNKIRITYGNEAMKIFIGGGGGHWGQKTILTNADAKMKSKLSMKSSLGGTNHHCQIWCKCEIISYYTDRGKKGYKRKIQTCLKSTFNLCLFFFPHFQEASAERMPIQSSSQCIL